jgi:anti-sigma B factor antagonist
MEITVESREGGATVVHVNGRLDLLTASTLKTRLAAEIARVNRVVVDLGDVSFIDSTGLGSIISGLKAARVAGGDLRIARPNKQAKVILELTTLDRVLRPYETVEEATIGF